MCSKATFVIFILKGEEWHWHSCCSVSMFSVCMDVLHLSRHTFHFGVFPQVEPISIGVLGHVSDAWRMWEVPHGGVLSPRLQLSVPVVFV